MRQLFKTHPVALIASLAAHLLLAAVLLLGVDFDSDKKVQVTPVNTVKATVIDGAKIKAAADKLKKIEQKKKRDEKKRVDTLKKKRLLAEQKKKDIAKQKIAKKKAAEAARLAKIKQQKKNKAVKAKKLAAKQKKLKEAEKKKAVAKRKAAEKIKREKAQQLAEQKQRQLDAAESERLFQQEMAREEEQAQADEALASYSGLIQQKVQQSWIQPAADSLGFSCVVQVKLIPGGEVVDAQVIKSSGNALFDRSVERATRKASPLPLPADPSLFKYFRTIQFKFDPQVN